jgi:hypothetical protein
MIPFTYLVPIEFYEFRFLLFMSLVVGLVWIARDLMLYQKRKGA